MPTKTKGEKKFDKIMKEWGQGKIKSSSGGKVKDQKMALAIAFSEKKVAESKAKKKK